MATKKKSEVWKNPKHIISCCQHNLCCCNFNKILCYHCCLFKTLILQPYLSFFFVKVHTERHFPSSYFVVEVHHKMSLLQNLCFLCGPRSPKTNFSRLVYLDFCNHIIRLKTCLTLNSDALWTVVREDGEWFPLNFEFRNSRTMLSAWFHWSIFFAKLCCFIHSASLFIANFFHLFNKLESFSIKFIKRRFFRRGSFLFFPCSPFFSDNTQQRNLFINLNYTFVHQIVLKMNFLSASFLNKNLILFVS